MKTLEGNLPLILTSQEEPETNLFLLDEHLLEYGKPFEEMLREAGCLPNPRGPEVNNDTFPRSLLAFGRVRFALLKFENEYGVTAEDVTSYCEEYSLRPANIEELLFFGSIHQEEFKSNDFTEDIVALGSMKAFPEPPKSFWSFLFGSPPTKYSHPLLRVRPKGENTLKKTRGSVLWKDHTLFLVVYIPPSFHAKLIPRQIRREEYNRLRVGCAELAENLPIGSFFRHPGGYLCKVAHCEDLILAQWEKGTVLPRIGPIYYEPVFFKEPEPEY